METQMTDNKYKVHQSKKECQKRRIRAERDWIRDSNGMSGRPLTKHERRRLRELAAEDKTI
jgi:uncharacterized FlgJ-related protein